MLTKENNPAVIANDINSAISGSNSYWPSSMGYGTCSGGVSGDSPQVTCVVNVSAYEDTLQGDALFGHSTGIKDDTMQQQFCCGLNVTANGGNGPINQYLPHS